MVNGQMFLISDFSSAGSLAHILFTTFTWTAVDPRCFKALIVLDQSSSARIFLIRIWIVLMLCFTSSLLILLHVKCWYRSKALP